MKSDNKAGIKPKQIAAIICIALLVLLYVATLVIALLGFPGYERLLAACLVATIGLPILLWIYIWLFGKYTRRPTIADIFPDPPQTTYDEKSSENRAYEPSDDSGSSNLD